MISALMLSRSDAADQDVVVGSAQGTAVERARIRCGAAVQHPDLQVEGSARSVAQFKGVLLEAAPGVAYAPVAFD